MTTRSLLAAVAITAMGLAPALAQNAQPPNTKPPPRPAPTAPPIPQPDRAATPAQPGQPGQPSIEEAEMWMKSAMPGENHRLLNAAIGEWDADCKFWMSPDPGAPAAESHGTMTNSWILDNRFVKQEFKGTMDMGGGTPMPFTGLGYMGYDNNKKKYTATWMDSMSTGVMYNEGSYDAGSKTFTFTGEHVDPHAKTVRERDTVRIVDDNNHVFTMYATEPGLPERKIGEISYHRRNRPMEVGPSDTPMPRPMAPSPAAPKR
jgi:uncharacterized protein DUF1579